VTDGNKWPQNAIFRLAQMAPPVECDLDYRLRALNPNPNQLHGQGLRLGFGVRVGIGNLKHIW